MMSYPPKFYYNSLECKIGDYNSLKFCLDIIFNVVS